MKNKKLSALLSALLFVCIAQGQIFNTPNNTYGTNSHRAVFDSTVYFPTGCGAPTDTTSLRSFGFNGQGQKVRMSAIYFDSCGHNLYIYDPTNKTWPLVGGSIPSSDSIYARNDSLFYTRNGTPHFSGVVLQPIVFTNKLPGDYVVLGSDTLTLVNMRPPPTTCDNTGNIQLSYVVGLQFAYNAGTYNIGCLPYTIATGSTVTLANGTASAGEFRTDAIILTSGGVSVITGTNSTGGVGAFPDIDPATQILLAYVRIDAANTVPSGITGITVYYDNVAATEFSHTSTGLTIAFNFGTNPQSGDSSINITTASNGGNFFMISPTILSKNSISNVSFWIRNDATFAAARNWVVRLYNGANQVTGSIAITLNAATGYSKNLLNTWQLISIPIANFQGADAFDRIQFRNTGTGGTLHIQYDNIKFEQGIVIGNPPPFSGNYLPLIHVSDNVVAQNGFTTEFSGGITRIGHVDSVGAEINYSWATNPLSYWSVSGATPTTGSSVTAIAGAAALAAPISSGVENWHFDWTIIPQTKASAQNDVVFQLLPTFGNASFTRKVTLLVRDTAFYFNYYKNDGATTPDYTNRGLFPFQWSAFDTIDIKAVFRQGRMTFTAIDRATGSKSELFVEQVGSIGLYNIANTGVIQLKQLGASSSFKYFGNFKYTVDEPTGVGVAFLGDSHIIGSGSIGLMYRWIAKAMKDFSDTWTGFAGSGERSADGIIRIRELIDFIKPKIAVWAYGTNDPGSSITAVNYATYLRQFCDSMVAHSIFVIICTPTPQATNMSAYRDSSIAIGGRYHFPVANFFAPLVASAGTNRDASVDADGVHFNSAGQTIQANAFVKVASQYLHRVTPMVVPNAPLNYEFDRYLAVKDGKVVSVNDGGSGKYIKNLFLSNSTVDAQVADISVRDGRYLFINNGALGTGEFIITGLGGSLSNPAFMQRNDSVFTSNLNANIFHSANQYLSGTTTLFNAGINLYANGNFNETTDNFNDLVLSGTTAVYGHTFNTTGVIPATYQHLRLQNGGVTKAWINARGGFYGDTVHGYDRHIPYAEFGPNDIYSKAIVDSLLALGGGGGGGGTFVGLSDGPGSFTGNSLKSVRVNVGETGLEYYTPSAGGGADAQLSNLSGTVAIPNGVHLLPATSGAVNLGSTSKPFGNLYLPNSGTIDFHAGGATITTTGTDGVIVNTGVSGFTVNGGSNAGFIGLAGAYGQISNGSGDLYITTAAGATNIILRTASTERMRIDPNGNLLINGTSASSGAAYTLQMFNTSNPPTGNISGAILYADAGEMKVRDASGNVTTISPHNVTGLPYHLQPMGWTYHSEKDNQYITVDMLKMAQLVEKLSKEKLIYKGKVKKAF